MRDLSEQEIKDLYQTEYDNQAPDVWADIERKLKLKAAEAGQEPVMRAAEAGQEPVMRAAEAGQEPGVRAAEASVHGKMHDAGKLSDRGSEVLDFPRVGKKRWLSIIGSVAACFVIIGAYMWQSGSVPFTNGSKDASPMTEAALEESGTAAAPIQAESGSGKPSGEVEESAEMSGDSIGTDGMYVNGIKADTTGLPAAEQVFICVNGRIYAYISNCALPALDLRELEYIGSAIPVEEGEKPKEHLQVSSPDISGEVYFDGDKTVYVVDKAEETAYIFTQE